MAFSPDGRLAAGGGDRTLRLWDPTTGKAVGAPLTGHTEPIYAVAFSPDGKRLATTSGDRTVRTWDPTTRRAIGAPLIGHNSTVHAVAFSQGGGRLASGSDGIVRLWDPGTNRTIGTPLTSQSGLMAFAPDGQRLAVSGQDGKVRLWEPISRTLSPPLTGQFGSLFAIAFSADGRTTGHR